MQKYILKNLRKFMREDTAIFTIAVICHVISILLSFFSYGVFRDCKINMAVNIFIAVVSAVSCSMMFKQVLKKREFTLSVFRLVGCNINKSRRMYIVEALLIIIPVLIVCVPAYHFVFLPLLDKMFPSIGQAYSLRIYAVMSGIYLLINYIVINVMILLHLKKTPVLIIKDND